MKKKHFEDDDKGVQEPCTTHNDERIVLPDDFADMSQYMQKKSIVEAIRKHYPDTIDETVFHFPFNFFYFVTDKEKFFSIQKRLKAPVNSDVAIQFEKKFAELTVREALNADVSEELKEELANRTK